MDKVLEKLNNELEEIIKKDLPRALIEKAKDLKVEVYRQHILSQKDPVDCCIDCYKPIEDCTCDLEDELFNKRN